MAKTRKFDFYNDPGHGWMKAPRKLLKEFGIEHQVSCYSYQRGDHVYLEEDCDAGLLINAMRSQGWEVSWRDHYSNKNSRIRNYESYKATA
jgi:hypothetical protein